MAAVPKRQVGPRTEKRSADGEPQPEHRNGRAGGGRGAGVFQTANEVLQNDYLSPAASASLADPSRLASCSFRLMAS